MKPHTNERIFYILGLILLAGGLVCFIGQITGLLEVTHLFPPCFFHAITGYYCPGCGCTRAVRCLFTGDFLGSLRNNPIVLYFTIFYLIFMITHTIEWVVRSIDKRKGITKGNPLLNIHGIKFRPIYVYIGLFIILIQCAIKNYILYTH